MSKEKQEIKVLDEPVISHNINLNMGASDIIELYIEENMERVLIAVQGLLNLIFTALDTTELDEKLTALAASYFKKLPFTPNKILVYWKKPIIDSKPTKLVRIRYSLDKVAENFLKSSKGQELIERDHYFEERQIDYVKITSVNGSQLTVYAKDLPAQLVKDANKLLFVSIKEQKKQIVELSTMEKDLYTLVQEYKELGNSRKIKARFTKKALSQTSQGKGLLEFINSGKTLSLLD